MERVEKDEMWSLFDPRDTPQLTETFGEEFRKKYREVEARELYKTRLPARELYAQMMKTLAQTGTVG